jgi:hypothetical protein
VLNVHANGLRAGEEGAIASPAAIRIQAYACGPVERIDLLRNDRCLHSWLPSEVAGALDVDLEWIDPAPRRENAYYVRLRQVDGEYAWSTPVWATCAGGEAGEDDRLPPWNAHEPVDLAALRSNAAEAHEAALRRYLDVEEDLGQFHDLTPVRLLDEVTGRSALFFAYFGPERRPISIRWYYTFAMPRIHLDEGWRDFGTYPTGAAVDEIWVSRTGPVDARR